MSVLVAGNQRLEPFARVGQFDPIATMIGTAFGTGDATGGVIRIRWTLNADFAYIFRYVSASTSQAANLRLSVIPGIIIDAVTEIWERSFDSFDVDGSNSAFFVGPPVLLLPQVAPLVEARTVNTNLDTLQASFRALIFERALLTQVSPSAIAQWLA